MRRPISGAKRRAVRSRRNTSRARFFAEATSSADACSGTPSKLQASNARASVSWQTSSARARFATPKTRVKAASSLRKKLKTF
jgi:hypothetical protein